MSKFLAVFTESEYQDDHYAIGSGVRSFEIEAESYGNAYDKAMKLMRNAVEGLAYVGIGDVLKLELFEFTRKEVFDIRKLLAVEKEIEAEKLEREQYEILRAKFEKVKA